MTLRPKKRRVYLTLIWTLFALVSLALLYPEQAAASEVIDNTIGRGVALIVGWIAWIITHILGLILTLLIKILVNVAKFNNIVNVATVESGWTIVRDICNMFFILIFLIIAFATILRYENYSAKRLLPKLLIMAVLINFSKTIFGLVIDGAQIIMLTFVRGFGSLGYNNLVELFQVNKLLAIGVGGEVDGDSVNFFAVTGAIIAGVFAMILTIIVVCVMLAILVMRIIMLWVYTIFAPLIFLGFAFPPIGRYTSRAFEDFVKQVVIGPVLAFFIWLALTTAQQSSTALGSNSVTTGSEVCAGLNAFFCESSFQVFIITIALLIGGMMITQQFGAAAARASGFAQKWSKAGMRWGGRQAWRGTKATAKEGWAQAQKTSVGRKVDLVTKKYAGSEAGKAAAIGAAVGTAVPGVGTAIGAGIGFGAGALIKNFKNVQSKLTTRRKTNQRLADAALKDRGAGLGKDLSKTDNTKEIEWNWNDKTGAYHHVKNKDKILKDEKTGERIHRFGKYEEGGKEYRRRSLKDKNYYQVDGMGRYTKTEADGNDYHVDAVDAGKAKAKAMSKGAATRWAGYAGAKQAGWQAKDAAEEEQISKTQQTYMTQSTDMLNKMMKIEQDGNKKMAIALATAIKGGFKDAKQVNGAKESFGGNTMLLSKFDDAMNKRHMYLNNTKADGSLDEAKIARLVSSGSAKYEDQDWSTINRKALDMWAKQDTKFGENLKKSIKTDRDSAQALNVTGDLDGRKFGKSDMAIRKMYGSLSGDYLKAFDIEKGQSIAAVEGTENYKNLKNTLGKISNPKILADVDNDQLDNEVFQKAFSDSVNIGMMKKIAKSNDLSTERINKFMEIVAKNNEKMFDQMTKDAELKSYVPGHEE